VTGPTLGCRGPIRRGERSRGSTAAFRPRPWAGLGWAINGFVQAYPDMRDAAEANLDDTGRKALADTSTM
jgi:hypothetical protein